MGGRGPLGIRDLCLASTQLSTGSKTLEEGWLPGGEWRSEDECHNLEIIGISRLYLGGEDHLGELLLQSLIKALIGKGNQVTQMGYLSALQKDNV